MSFSKLFIVSVLTSLAAAAAVRRGDMPDGCKPPPPVAPPTSPQCCASVVDSSSSAASLVAAVLSLDLTGIAVPVGLSCSPITVLGNNCGGTTVTCQAPENEWGGLIAINCIPITL
ncbi:hydrophobin 2 [Mycena filopes]|nr:hydrophobin 2 [Mycena filopes]